ncbi:MAG: helix-turn-helix domain-containing protein [Tannerella sp.]|jgi:AraC-like DNA-binding protein|nr:helix-turn-helix domain-containing protein [Tannerella sp.]
MKKGIARLRWKEDLGDKVKVDFRDVDDDFILSDHIKILPAFSFPFSMDVTTIMICIQGTARGKIGLKSYETLSPGVIILLAGEILQYESVSDDFKGLFMVMSERLADSLLPDVRNWMAVTFSIRENPFLPLNGDELDLLKSYYEMLKKVVVMTDSLHRKEIVRLFMKAFYYFLSTQQQKISPKRILTKREESVRQFMDLVQKHYRTERKISFYACKMCRTPKYLSQTVKTYTGRPANEWIDRYVMIEAKALLKSTQMTVQQISDELHFGDQSLFGKYFKHLEGVSPKEYREG